MSKKAVEVLVKFKPVTSGRPVQVVAADGSEGAVFAMSGQSKK